MKQNIALVFGGVSSEHDVSIKSFETIYKSFKKSDKLSKNLKKIFYITRDAKVCISNVDFNNGIQKYCQCDSADKLETIFSLALEEELFLFSTIHGQYGEDGSLQGIGEFFGIKNNFGTVLSTSISMSKYHLNRYLEGKIKNLYIPKTFKISTIKDIGQLKQFDDQEIIVKPNSLGSSILTQKFLCNDNNMEEITILVKKALEFDNNVLIQEFIKGDEYSCGCLEKSKSVITLPIVKILAHDDFFSHEAKYTKGKSQNIVIPLSNQNDIDKAMQKISFEIFEELNFHAMARFDYIVKDKKIYFLEANTLPGLKSSSIYPCMLKEYGVSLEDLIVILINNELQRKQKLTKMIYDVS